MKNYMNMLVEYKRSEAALRERIAELNEKLKGTMETIEREDTLRRKLTLEQELYDILDVIYRLYDYAGCGESDRCRNA
ncbi:MAG: hypothetical protein K2N26_07395 [Oscillospiraceae bacterium]|nr:hypothetical protein [Oscillospiraceae bacterium]